jgi:hypothetical protein
MRPFCRFCPYWPELPVSGADCPNKYRGAEEGADVGIALGHGVGETVVEPTQVTRKANENINCVLEAIFVAQLSKTY